MPEGYPIEKSLRLKSPLHSVKARFNALDPERHTFCLDECAPGNMCLTCGRSFDEHQAVFHERPFFHPEKKTYVPYALNPKSC